MSKKKSLAHSYLNNRDIMMDDLETTQETQELKSESGKHEDAFQDKSRSNKQQTSQNIFFVGLTGAGKTSVGWGLAKEIGMGFLDLDEWIEETHEKPIADIFEDEGEQVFRHIERQAVKQVLNVKNHIISLGGGTVMDDKNWDLIRENGITILDSRKPLSGSKKAFQ